MFGPHKVGESKRGAERPLASVMSRPRGQNRSPAACLSSLAPQPALPLNSAPRTLNTPAPLPAAIVSTELSNDCASEHSACEGVMSPCGWNYARTN